MTKLYEAWGYKASLPNWAAMFDLDRSTLYKRIERGMDMETALSMKMYQSDKWPKYTYNGESHTAREWAEIIGITAGAFRDRINDGLPPEKVFAKRDLRIKDDEKRPTQMPDAEKGFVLMLVSNDLGQAPSVKRVKASEIDSVRKEYKYTMVLRRRA